jgi:hypothetical protein
MSDETNKVARMVSGGLFVASGSKLGRLVEEKLSLCRDSVANLAKAELELQGLGKSGRMAGRNPTGGSWLGGWSWCGTIDTGKQAGSRSRRRPGGKQGAKSGSSGSSDGCSQKAWVAVSPETAMQGWTTVSRRGWGRVVARPAAAQCTAQQHRNERARTK